MAIWITGDKHGMASDLLVSFGSVTNPSEDDTLIICGDFGAEYGVAVNGRLKKAAKKFPGQIVVLRGNHDARYWSKHTDTNGTPENGWHIEVSGFQKNCYGKFLVQDKYPNIKYIQDEGGLYFIDGYTFLMIPGAYSIDKYHRLTNGMNYEFREQLTKEEMKKLSYISGLWYNEIDFVVSHTCPMKLEPKLQYLFLDFVDQTNVDKTMEHWMDDIAWEIEQGNKFKQWYFGHFHDDKTLDDKYTMLYNVVVPIERYV